MAWRHYWWNMVQRAHGDTLRTLHLEQPRRWMIAIALYLITILLLLAAGAITQAMDQASTGIALVAALVIVHPVFFCYNLLRAPDRVDQEKKVIPLLHLKIPFVTLQKTILSEMLSRNY
jgi:hypothetical protein